MKKTVFYQENFFVGWVELSMTYFFEPIIAIDLLGIDYNDGSI